jgi:hypothetical protein
LWFDELADGMDDTADSRETDVTGGGEVDIVLQESPARVLSWLLEIVNIPHQILVSR